MASCDDTEPLDIPDTWDYGVKIPPYTLSDRAMPSCMTLEDLYAVGLGAIPEPTLDDVLRLGSNREDRIMLARRIRCNALDVLFRDMYRQDDRTWEDCLDMFRSRLVELGHFEECSEWVADIVERLLRGKEKSDPADRTKPADPEHATYHLVERFFTVLDGTVWLETACDDDTEHSQRKAVGDRRYRNCLARPVANRVVELQRALIESCRAADAGCVGLPSGPEAWVYEDAAELVKDHWQDIEDAEVWV